MYELNDTIAAVSSPTSDKRVIVRITGPETIDVLQRIFAPLVTRDKGGLVTGSIAVDDELRIEAKLYLFLAPHSYTGDDVAEIHIHTNSSVTEAVMARLLGEGLRIAGPGEFTARAYLNGKIDLAQAEAVNEIITASNRFQLDAAEKLLLGRLAETTEKIRSEIIDCLSLIEAGLDFSQQDIEFITTAEAVEKLTVIENQLQQLLSGNISYEAVIDLPVVGIVGAPNSGKSSLLNKLLGRERSIVSKQRKTTRDVLTGLLRLKHCKCVLFDCAGLVPEPDNILDELAQAAAIEAVRKALVVVFCVDVSKTDWAEDVSIRELIKLEVLIPVAIKSDLLSEQVLVKRLAQLNELFGTDFLAVSAKTGTGVELLRDTIDKGIIELTVGSAERNTCCLVLSPQLLAKQEWGHRQAKYEIRDTKYSVALTARHKQAITEAIENIGESINELKAGNDEITAMLLRAAYQAVSNIEQETIDEQVLERIFSRFCVGK